MAFEPTTTELAEQDTCAIARRNVQNVISGLQDTGDQRLHAEAAEYLRTQGESFMRDEQLIVAAIYYDGEQRIRESLSDS